MKVLHSLYSSLSISFTIIEYIISESILFTKKVQAALIFFFPAKDEQTHNMFDINLKLLRIVEELQIETLLLGS